MTDYGTKIGAIVTSVLGSALGTKLGTKLGAIFGGSAARAGSALWLLMLSLFISALLPLHPASAQNYYTQSGDWTISSGEYSCGMSKNFSLGRRNRLTLLRGAMNGDALIIENGALRMDDGAVKTARFQIDNQIFGPAAVRGLAQRNAPAPSPRGPAFLAFVDEQFTEALAKGNRLSIYIDDTLIDRMPLDGTGAAIDALKNCVNSSMQGFISRDRPPQGAAFAPLPNGPALTTGTGSGTHGANNANGSARGAGAYSGANSAAASTGRATSSQPPQPPHSPQSTYSAQSALSRPPTPRGNANWIRAGDYPNRALREGRGGKVGFTLSISSNGRVTQCQISLSSNHTDLDAKTCQVITRRARFNPAKDAQGNDTSGTYSSAIAWQIP